MEYALLVKPSYLNDRAKLPPDIQKKILRSERLLAEDFRSPGLQTKKLHHSAGLFEARVDLSYRLVYSIESGIIQLLAVGDHAIIDNRLDIPAVPTAVREAAKQDATAVVASVVPPTPQPSPAAIHNEPPARPPTETPTPSSRSISITKECLNATRVPESYQPLLLACTTEDQLLSARIPESMLQAVVSYLYPPSIEEVREEPTLVVAEVEDLQRQSEGELVAFLLKLDDDQAAAVQRSLDAASMVRGGPGTGKSTVAIYRVKALFDKAAAEGKEPPRVLFTTFTNSLVEVSRQLIDTLVPSQNANITVSTIDKIAMDILTTSGKRPMIATPKRQQEALAAARATVSAQEISRIDERLAQAGTASVRDEYLLEEFEWVVEGRGLRSREDYLTVDRRGRGYAFDRRSREAVWNLYEVYRDHMERTGHVTWKRLGGAALDLLRSGAATERWDSVIIDEAQDLAPVSLALAVEICRSPDGLFFAADGAQSIYHKGFRFSQLDEKIQLRGRSTVLRRNYRSTREIALAMRDLMDPEVGRPEAGMPIDGVRGGEKPVVIRGDTIDEQTAILAREVRAASKRLHLPISSFAILCPSNRLADECAKRLTSHGVPAEVVKGKELRLGSPSAKTMTIHTAKGLEFPMVAVLPVDEGELPRPLPEDSEDLEEHIEGQRRLLFVGCTRAMRKLWVTTTRGRESRFLAGIKDETWTWVEK